MHLELLGPCHFCKRSVLFQHLGRIVLALWQWAFLEFYRFTKVLFLFFTFPDCYLSETFLCDLQFIWIILWYFLFWDFLKTTLLANFCSTDCIFHQFWQYSGLHVVNASKLTKPKIMIVRQLIHNLVIVIRVMLIFIFT